MYQYRFKTKGKETANYVCASKGCYASISLAIENGQIKRPAVITHESAAHKHKQDGSCKHNQDYFNKKIFLFQAKRLVETNTEKTPH